MSTSDEIQTSKHLLMALLEHDKTRWDRALTQHIDRYKQTLDEYTRMIEHEDTKYLLLKQQTSRVKESSLALETELKTLSTGLFARPLIDGSLRSTKGAGRKGENEESKINPSPSIAEDMSHIMSSSDHKEVISSNTYVKPIPTDYTQPKKREDAELSITKYEFDEGEHCFEIDNTKSTHFTDLALYCEEICQYSERFELLPLALILLPFDFDLTKELKHHTHLTFYVMLRDGSKISNKFQMELSLSMDSANLFDEEVFDTSFESFQAPVKVIIDCEGSEGGELVVRLANVSTEDVTGNLFSVEDFVDLTDELLLQPDVPREVRIKVSPSTTTLKFFTRESVELGTFTLAPRV
jgi:hypothetical protein